VRVGFLGPEGTFTEEALMADPPPELEPVALETVHATVMAVHDGDVDRAIAPIENTLEGSVDATLDALAGEAHDVRIVGEVVHPIHQCLIAATELAAEDIEAVVSHPHATAQCARFLRSELPRARVLASASTAGAVRDVVEAPDRRWAAIGPRLAAELYGATVLRAGVEDAAGNATRFVWLARAGEAAGAVAGAVAGAGGGAWKTSLVFWGAGAEQPGWLVRCLSEFAFRGVNLTKIESRPRKERIGRYMFFVDLDGSDAGPAVADAVRGLRAHCEDVRTLGSYPGAGAR
jgi:prephenate dehydratase